MAVGKSQARTDGLGAVAGVAIGLITALTLGYAAGVSHRERGLTYAIPAPDRCPPFHLSLPDKGGLRCIPIEQLREPAVPKVRL